MESVKKWLTERTAKKNGLYVHYSPPKVVGRVSAAELRQWARDGAAVKLQRAVLAGQGRRLLAAADALPLAHLPNLIAKCDALHAAVDSGSLLQLQELLDSDYHRRKYIMCSDEAGVGLLHKAIYFDYMDIAEWLVENYPQLVHQKDSEGRTPLHYSAACRDPGRAASLLEGAGAARGVRDAAGHTPAFYRGQRTLLALPQPQEMAPEPGKNPQGLVIKRHNIRIWCHECDMSRLQRVVWEGHGARLLSEVSNQPIVKRFLEAVPYIMNTIRDIHNAVIQNDLEGLMKLAGDPVPAQILSSRDNNNMTVMHKAAGLGHGGILGYIAERYPQGINDVDNDGRTPLHYAAAVKDDQHMYNTLVSLGADEGAIDHKNKPPGYYVNKPNEIDHKLLKTLPDAPRTASSAYPPSWDWKILDAEAIVELNKKSRKKHLRASNENISLKNLSNSMSENTNNRRGGMKASSTQEFIKDLPDLDDNIKRHNGTVGATKESEVEESHEEENDEEEKNDKNKTDEIEEMEDPEHPTEENAEDVEVTDKPDNPNEVANVEGVYQENEAEDHSDTDDKIESDTKEQGEKEEESEPTQNAKEDHSKPEQDNDNQNEVEEIQNEKEDQDVPDQNEDEIHDENVLETDVDEHNTNQNEDDNSKGEEYIQEDEEKSELNGNKHNLIAITEKTFHEIEHTEHKLHNTIHEIEDHITNINKSHKVNETENIKVGEAQDDRSTKGNSTENREDDDDVQVQGDTQSEYSDIHERSTAEAINTESAKRGNETDGRNTQESLIEGIINGESEEDSQDASITQRDESVQGNILVVDNEIDPEVADLINTANMEMLATLVLNGEGSRLVGRRSFNAELQAFLDNVPTYMQKINKVHLAAKEGNIRDLQAALDRRKFAIARDPISPNGATPLHVATIFGKTNIMKYLGARFPETLSAVDFEGRTALHYAAVLPDNGHFYNLLQQLGANVKDLDDGGQSAEEYFKNPELLPYSQLLNDYDISEEVAQGILSDKVPEDRVSSRRALDIPEALETLERCYQLLASAKPSRTPLSASSNRATPPVVLGRFLKRHVFELIKHRVTKLDHDLFDVIWPAVKKLPDNRNIVQTVEEDFPGGITAPDYYVYEVYNEFLIPLIKDLHNINIHSELQPSPPSDFATKKPKSTEPFIELNIDPNDEFVLSGVIECSRNLKDFELPLNLKIGKLEAIERIITTLIMKDDFSQFSPQTKPESDQKGGSYYTLNEVLEKPSEICAQLAAAGLLIALCDRDEIDDSKRLHGRHWPYGRGVFVNDDKTVAIWINVHDHIRVLVSTPTETPGELGLPFSKMTQIMTYLHEKLDFVWDYKLGYLSSRPTFLGSGIRFSLIIHFPGLSKDPENMKHLCAMRGLQYRETLNIDIARVSNYQCLGLSETNCFNDFITATSNLLHLEKDLSMQNSAHITTMLTNIFKRKRSSLADSDMSERPEE